jgi:hypothetical protein
MVSAVEGDSSLDDFDIDQYLAQVQNIIDGRSAEEIEREPPEDKATEILESETARRPPPAKFPSPSRFRRTVLFPVRVPIWRLRGSEPWGRSVQ